MKYLFFKTLFLALVGCTATQEAGDVLGPHDDASIPDAVDLESPFPLTVMSFNVGTTNRLPHRTDPDGYSDELADLNASYFSDNLAWVPAQLAVREMIDALKPDVIAFQEVFYDPDCEELCPTEQDPDDETPAIVCQGDTFPCDAWHPGGEITARRIVGPDYDLACAPGRPENCVAVLRTVATLEGVEDDLEIGVLDGMRPPNECTSGARVATGVVHLGDGTSIAVVNVHATALLAQECREAQFRQIFEDRGDGRPAAFGEHNLVMGDMNMDPFLMCPQTDKSVAYWKEHVGEGKAFQYLSSADREGPDTHPYTFMKLDHVISDSLTGSCVVLGETEGTSAPLSEGSTYFDHRPILCTVDL